MLKTTMFKRILGGMAAAALTTLCAPALAMAEFVETDTYLGDVAAAPSGLLLSTAALDSGETPTSATSALIYFDLEAALGGVSLGSDSFEGSALLRRFSTSTASTLRFDWTLATEHFDAALADRAFVLLDGSVLQALGTVSPDGVGGVFSHTFSSAGLHSVAIGVVDVGDFVGVSTLTLGGLGVTAVPEPGTWALLLAGLGLLGAAARRRG